MILNPGQQNSPEVLTIIPARGGSKGVPRKNLKIVGGKPLIAWTILAAKESNFGRNIVVSTEDLEIQQVSEEYGVEIIERPMNLAQDSTPMIEVVQHALTEFEKTKGLSVEYILLLQPTSPLRTANDINAALVSLVNSSADSILSVYRLENYHPSKMYTIEEGYLDPIARSLSQPCRQNLVTTYHRNGAIFACQRSLFEEERCLWGGKILPYVMPREQSIDIDSFDDLDRAQRLIILNRSSPLI
jgi:N-acylneuraminate cytidylyltransferase